MNSRRHALKSVAAATGLSALGLPLTTWAQSGELVVAAAPPITGVFAFAGVGLNMGVNDYCEWRNEARGGIMGRKLRYISDDSGWESDTFSFDQYLGQAMAKVRQAQSTHTVEALLDDIDGRVANHLLRAALFSAARDVAGADHEIDAEEQGLLGQIAARFG